MNVHRDVATRVGRMISDAFEIEGAEDVKWPDLGYAIVEATVSGRRVRVHISIPQDRQHDQETP